VVLVSFFLSSSAIGVVQGSLSTTKKIIQNIEPGLNDEWITNAKYADLPLSIVTNFVSVWIIEKYGLRFCTCIGSCIMLFGSILRLMSISSNLYFWYAGHIICLLSGAFLKTPATKIATNWFGDKERGIASSVG